MNIGTILRRALGILLLLGGVVGLAFPFLQGFLMIAMGLYVLSIDSLWLRTKIVRFERQHPKLKVWFDAFDARMKKLLRYHNHDRR